MLQYYKYSIPFKQPFNTATGNITHREGIILVFKSKNLEAYGEVAPLSGFSEESLDQVQEVLKVNRDHLQKTIASGDGKQTIQLLDQIHGFPSLSFGLATLLHDLEAKQAGIPLYRYLAEDAPDSIKANATLPIQETAKAIVEAKELTLQGYETLKLKIGQNFNSELKLLQDLRNQFTGLNIRVDANQAWNKEEAIRNLKAMESLRIEYCEQPIPAGDPEDLKAISDSVQVAIAADESVRNKSQAMELSKLQAVQFFIIKPMLLGTFDNIFVTNKLANTHNIESIFTTSLESAIGRAATAAVCAGLISRNRGQGLATGSLLEKDLADASWLNGPIVKFPDVPGLGVTLNLEGLKELK